MKLLFCDVGLNDKQARNTKKLTKLWKDGLSCSSHQQ